MLLFLSFSFAVKSTKNLIEPTSYYSIDMLLVFFFRQGFWIEGLINIAFLHQMLG